MARTYLEIGLYVQEDLCMCPSAPWRQATETTTELRVRTKRLAGMGRTRGRLAGQPPAGEPPAGTVNGPGHAQLDSRRSAMTGTACRHSTGSRHRARPPPPLLPSSPPSMYAAHERANLSSARRKFFDHMDAFVCVSMPPHFSRWVGFLGPTSAGDGH